MTDAPSDTANANPEVDTSELDGLGTDAVPDATDEGDAVSDAIEVDADVGPDTNDGPAVRSAEDFADNEAGVVTAATVRRWLAEAQGESEAGSDEPVGLDGLVVLQLGRAEGSGSGGFLPSNTKVRTYDAPNLPRLLQMRSNGLIASQIAPGRGARVDSFLRNFGIDLRRDKVLLAAGAPTTTALADLARAWLTLRYWGVAHESLAILDGPVSEGFSPEELAFEPLMPPVDGTFRVPRLPTANFEILAYPEDVRAAIAAATPIVDLRTRDEFDGLALSSSAHDDTCLMGAPACTAIFAGRIAGSSHLALGSLADTTSLRWSPPARVDEALSALGLTARVEPILYDADGASSAIAAVSLLAVAGRSARWYAGSFVEWSALSANHPEPALRALPENSPWRVDLELTEALGPFATTDLGVRPLVLDPSTPSTDRITAEDARYRAFPPELPAVGTGDAICTP